jgi:hypothetical protein
MYRSTDPQGSLFTTATALPDSAKDRLSKSWAHYFALEIMPILYDVEDEFAPIYGLTGRPNWSVARKLGLCILQELFNLDDQRALDSMSFDVRWQHALGLTPQDAYLARRSLIDFRMRLLEHERSMDLLNQVFTRTSQAMLERFNVSVEQQRVDSTHITSNIRRRGRRALFGKVLEVFLRQLKQDQALQWDRLPDDIRCWYETEAEDIDSWFGPGQNQGPDLAELAKWFVIVRELYKGDSTIAHWESFAHVVQMIADHLDETAPAQAEDEQHATGDDIEISKNRTAAGLHASTDDDEPEPDPPKGGGKPRQGKQAKHQKQGKKEWVRVRKKPLNSGSTLHSPFDPDAALGHKGLGYSGHIVETCNNAEGPEVITACLVVPANKSDMDMSAEILSELASRKRLPNRLFADAGYISAAAIEHAQAWDVDLQGPMRSKLAEGTIGREAFDYDDDGRLLACPQGHAPLKTTLRRYRKEDNVPHAYFDRRKCHDCPIAEQCITRGGPANNRELADLPRLRLRDERLAQQKTPQWQTAYAIRAGAEATISELSRTHGLKRLRVRGQRRVTMAVVFKATSCNVKRWLKAVV